MIEAKTPKLRLLWLRAMAAVAPCSLTLSLLCTAYYQANEPPGRFAPESIALLYYGIIALMMAAAATLAALIAVLCKQTPWRTFFWCFGLLILGILLFLALFCTFILSV